MKDLPNIDNRAISIPSAEQLQSQPASNHKPRILLLYGALREESYSRKLALEAQRVLNAFGAETKVFDPHGLPVFDRTSNDHPQVVKLRELSVWSAMARSTFLRTFAG